jgi:hypothetical protein
VLRHGLLVTHTTTRTTEPSGACGPVGPGTPDSPEASIQALLAAYDYVQDQLSVSLGGYQSRRPLDSLDQGSRQQQHEQPPTVYLTTASVAVLLPGRAACGWCGKP